MNEQEYTDALDALCVRSDMLVEKLKSWDNESEPSVAGICAQAIAVAIGHTIARLTEEYFDLPKGSMVGWLESQDE